MNLGKPLSHKFIIFLRTSLEDSLYVSLRRSSNCPSANSLGSSLGPFLHDSLQWSLCRVLRLHLREEQ